MKKNKVIIVEGKNDRVFLNELLNRPDVSIETIVPESTVEVMEMGGLDPKKLKKKIKDIIFEIPLKGIQKIGILIDQDDKTIDDRLKLINDSLEQACIETGAQLSQSLDTIDTFYELSFKGETVKVGCSLMHLDGRGELTDVLKAIKTQNSDHADCLSVWKECVESKGYKIKEKELLKLWVDFYIRWDTCTNQERYNASENCSLAKFENVLKKPIFDLDNDKLASLKNFLSNFN